MHCPRFSHETDIEKQRRTICKQQFSVQSCCCRRRTRARVRLHDADPASTVLHSSSLTPDICQLHASEHSRTVHHRLHRLNIAHSHALRAENQVQKIQIENRKNLKFRKPYHCSIPQHNKHLPPKSSPPIHVAFRWITDHNILSILPHCPMETI